MSQTIDPKLLKIAQDNLDKLPPEVQQKIGELVAQARKMGVQDKAQDDFMAFVNYVWPTFIHGRHHQRMARAFEKVARGECKRLIINMAPRHAIITSMNIPTTNGIKTLADLRIGDYVFGPDGLPTLVIGKSEVFHDREIYRVTTDDGFSIDVDGEHLWTVRLNRRRDVYHDYTTEQLWDRQNGAHLRTKRGGGVEILEGKRVANPRLPRLPDCAPVQYVEKNLLIDPYLLGVWLGDGSTNNAIVTCHDDDQIFIRSEIERRGYTTTDQKTKFSFGILDLIVKLRELGLLGNKYIPNDYLEGSVQQRLDLLRGLMDTDGNVSKKGQCFFSQKNLDFITQVRQLLASLGIKNSLQTSEAKIKEKSYGNTYRLSFYANDIAHLPRKESRTLKNDRTFGRYISIKKLNVRDNTQCIKVAREDGLFLAGEGFICTHNSKSEMASYLLPAWFLGKFPQKKIIQASYNAELATGFGRKVRNLVDSDKFKDVFPNVELRTDSKAAGRWNTNHNGDYFAIGVGGNMTGRGADIMIIDDPHSEQEATLAESDPTIYDKTYEWYTSGPRQRLQPGGAIIVVMTRWSKKDLTGQILKSAAQRSGENWELIELPAILPSDNPIWPEFWSKDELYALRRELPAGKWMAQYQQQPTSDVSAIIKREWWNIWDEDDPPVCEFVIQSWDTAFTKNERSDYSACTTWGVFYMEDDTGIHQANIILLDSFKKRMEFPELKQKTFEMWKDWEPDSIIIEAKASGAPLVFELRAMGIPVQEFTPVRGGGDKIARTNAIADIFASGRVWAPNRHWAEELIEEVGSFPGGEHDDLVDSMTMAMMRFRKGGFLRLPSDEEDEQQYFKRKVAYY